MKISNDTKDVLKNFSTINSGIRVKTGNKLETISNMKNILAVATVAEDFPQDFSIYNLPEFLGCLLYTSPSPRDATLSRMPSSA